MTTHFKKLNVGWNAQPNAPVVKISVRGDDLDLAFKPNAYLIPEYKAVSTVVITFRHCWRYRLGTVNDEGWFRGQCRFSRIAPAWGEFYEVSGDLEADELRDWVVVSEPTEGKRHFLFYFRDEEFECDAESWTKRDVAALEGGGADALS